MDIIELNNKNNNKLIFWIAISAKEVQLQERKLKLLYAYVVFLLLVEDGS
jgi:hypothetical protein